jgi:transposase
MARRLIEPNPENASHAELATAAKCARSTGESARFRAIIALVTGLDRGEVAHIFDVDERTLLRWIKAFNARGIDGLLDRLKPGRPKKIAAEKARVCLRALDRPQEAGRKHWTGVRFHGYLREELGIEVSYTTVLRFIRNNDYRLKVPQPWSDRHDEASRKAFREKLGELAGDGDVEIWFGDECGVEGEPKPRRRWAKRGEKVRGIFNGEHLRMNVSGMVCPRTGQFYALEFTHSDSETFQTFLDEANKDLALERKRQILVLDNASWHHRKSLRWGRFEPLYLPPYSPDLNPIERLWLLMKAEWFTAFSTDKRQILIDRLDKALLWLINRQENNRKTCPIPT